jgi:hypothetical protein
MRAVICLAAISTAFFFAPASADQIPGSRSDIAGWRISAHTFDASGKFSHCVMAAGYRSGITMRFAVSEDYTWRVGWDHPDWRLAVGQKVDLSLYVDGEGPYHVAATARGANQAIAELPANASLFHLFRKGYRLTVHAQGNRYDFNLDGTYAALTEVLDCARRYVAASAPKASPPPITGSSTAPTRQAPNAAPRTLSAEERLEATTLVANLLAQSDLSGQKILTSKELKEADLQDFDAHWHVTWRADDVLGMLRIVPKGVAGTATEVATDLIAKDSRSCGQGSFASGSTPDEKNPRTARLFTVCQAGKGSVDVRYIVVPRQEGGYYLFATLGLADNSTKSNKVTATDGLLRTAVYETLKR